MRLVALSSIAIPSASFIGTFTFSLDRPRFPQSDLESDLICARKVASHLSIALVEVARRIQAAGFSQVWMGEAADDLFGSFKFALRYYRGPQLRAYYRTQLRRDLPNELAIIQNIFSWFNLSVIQPLWTEPLLRIGYTCHWHSASIPAA